MSPETLLTDVSFALSATFGIIGLHHQYRDLATGRVTLWGKISLGGIIVCALVGGVGAYIKDATEGAERRTDSEKIANLERGSADALHQTNQIATNLDGGKMELVVDIPCTGQFEKFCNSETYPMKFRPGQTSGILIPTPDFDRNFPNKHDYGLFGYVDDAPLPECNPNNDPGVAGCNPGGKVWIFGKTNPKHWSFSIHYRRTTEGKVIPSFSRASMMLRDVRFISQGEEIASLESLRGRFLSIEFDGITEGMSVSGVQFLTKDGQQVSIGEDEIRPIQQKRKKIFAFHFPSDRDPRSFYRYIAETVPD